MVVKKAVSPSCPSIFYQTLARASQILYPHYPCYFFPSFLLIQTFNKLVELKKNPRLRVLPIPNKFHSILIAHEPYLSDHYCLVSDEIYDTHELNKKQNWLNIVFGAHNNSNGTPEKSGSPDLVQTILNKPNSSILLPVLAVAKCQKNCIFVSENCYENWRIKNKLKERQPLLIQVHKMTADQCLPRLANRATVFLIKNPYELPLDVTDEIITNYFTSPRILYRNHTYEIVLDEQQVGTSMYSQFFHIFSSLRKLYFRCIHLESSDCTFEHFAVVVKGATTLHQSTSINFPISRQHLDETCLVSSCPWGLIKYFKNLKACTMPFIGSSMTVPSAASSPATGSTNVKKPLLSNRIFPAFLIQSDRGAGKRLLVNAVAMSLGFQQYVVDCTEISSSQIPAQTEAKLKLVLAKANLCEPLFFILNNFEVFGVDNEGREDLRVLTMFQKELHNLFSKERAYPIVLIALSNGKILKPIIQSQFLETITIDAPDKNERYNNLQWLLHKEIIMQEIYNSQRNDFSDVPLWDGRCMKTVKYQLSRQLKNTKNLSILEKIADKTQGFLFGDLKLLFDNGTKNMLRVRNVQSMTKFEDSLQMDNFIKHLQEMQSDFSDSLGAPKVPKVLWSDIGGLAKLKDEIQSSIGLPLKHVHLLGKNMRRSGILLYGPPGTGKTLVAKAVATECNLSFLSVQGPELLNMYVGQSEQNVREVFTRARSAAPCVIFLDELDSLAPNRGAAGDSGGVMDRVVSQLLAEMDDMVGSDADQQKQIFILAATNRPDLIDPALLRPGRFDKLLYVGPCVTVDDKSAVLTAQMKKFNLSDGLSIKSIASLMKEEMTGADIYSVCSNAWLSAVRKTITNHQDNDDDETTESLTSEDVLVNLNDFRTAIANFVPSINKKDMEYFNNLRAAYSLGN